MTEREVEKDPQLHGKFQSGALEAKFHSPQQKVKTSLQQATSKQYLIDLTPIYSSYRCSLNYMALNKVNMQDDNTQLRIKVHETQLPTHKIMSCSHRCKTTIGNYRRQCNHSVLNNKKTQFQHSRVITAKKNSH